MKPTESLFSKLETLRHNGIEWRSGENALKSGFGMVKQLSFAEVRLQKRVEVNLIELGILTLRSREAKEVR